MATGLKKGLIIWPKWDQLKWWREERVSEG